MKKFLTTAAAVLILLMLASCGTAGAPVAADDLTDSDAAYAMETALSAAVLNAGLDFMGTAGDIYSSLPASYDILKEMQDMVPGMRSLMDIWREDFREYLISSFEGTLESISALAAEVKFDNPFYYVNLSDTSGTDYFMSIHGDEVYSYFLDIAMNADYSNLEKVRNQYNIYIRMADFVGGTRTEELKEADTAVEIADKLYSRFAGLLSENEELFRTTPDPYLNPRVIAVFGNN